MEKKQENKYVSNLYMKIAGFGALAYWFGIYIKTYYGAYYITDILCLSPAIYSLITSITSICGFFVAPAIGAIVDCGKQGRWGKYRKWLIIGPCCYSFFYILSFLPIFSNAALLSVFLVVTWTCTTLCEQMILMPYYALHAQISNSPNQRTQFVSKRNFFVNVASLIYSVTNTAIIAFFAKVGGSPLWGYSGFVIFAGILNVILFYCEFKMIGNAEEQMLMDFPALGVKEKDVNAEGGRVKGPSVKDFFKNILTNLPFALVAVQQFQFGFATGLRNMFYVYYFNAVINNPSLYSVYIFLNSWMGIAATLTLPVWARKYENTQIAFAAFAVETITCVGMRFTLMSSPWTALVLAMLFRYCSIIVGSINASMFQDTAVYAEWKNGTDTMATIIGGSQVVGTIGSLITSALFSIILIGSGYKAGESITPSVSAGIINALTIYPMLSAMIAAVCAKLNPLTNAKLVQYKTEIDNRKDKRVSN